MLFTQLCEGFLCRWTYIYSDDVQFSSVQLMWEREGNGMEWEREGRQGIGKERRREGKEREKIEGKEKENNLSE